MATIGSGTKVLPNIVGTATWRPQDMDQSLAAFAEQIGGVAWGGGIPLIYGGNLDSANFASGMLLDGRYLSQPNSYGAMSVATRADPDFSSVKMYYGTASSTMRISSVCLGTVIPSAAGVVQAVGTATVSIGGVQVASFSVSWVASATDAQYPVQTAAVSAWVNDGTEILVDFSGVSFTGAGVVTQPTVTLIGYSGLTA